MTHFWLVFICFTSFGVVSLTEVQFSEKELHSTGLESRILNGRKAKLGQFPWQAALSIPLPEGGNAQCGGTLIDKRWILTAAHCLNTTIQNIKIYLGTTHYTERRVGRSRIEFWSSDFHIHRDYNGSYPLINDIALIKIPSHVKFNKKNKNIRPISLIHEELPPGTKVTVSGWGKTHEDFYVHRKYKFRFMLEDDTILIKFPAPLIKFLNYTIPFLRTFAMKLPPGPKIAGKGWRISRKVTKDNLLFARLKIGSNETCRGHPESVAGTICARGKRYENICEGDSGGPLVYHDKANKTYFLVGVVSESSKVCTKGLPDGMYTSFYTDVYAFKEWIEGTMRNNSSF